MIFDLHQHGILQKHAFQTEKVQFVSGKMRKSLFFSDYLSKVWADQF